MTKQEDTTTTPPVQTPDAKPRKGRGPTLPRWQIATEVTLHEDGAKFKNESEALRVIERSGIEQAYLVRAVAVKVQRKASLA